MNLRISSGQLSDVGQKRGHNEDFIGWREPADPQLLAKKGSLYVVADGMGGHEAGEVASELVVRQLIDDYYGSPTDDVIEALTASLRHANTALIEAGRREQKKTGSTAVAAVIRGDRLYIVNVGDSRGYLIRQGTMVQLTEDHSFVAELIKLGRLTHDEALVHPQRNVLTRSLGTDPNLDFGMRQEVLKQGDVVLLCSDGLWGEGAEQEFQALLANPDPQRAAENLVDWANAKGGSDNISVIVVRVGLPPPERVQSAAAPTLVGAPATRAAPTLVDAPAAGAVPKKAGLPIGRLVVWLISLLLVLIIVALAGLLILRQGLERHTLPVSPAVQTQELTATVARTSAPPAVASPAEVFASPTQVVFLTVEIPVGTQIPATSELTGPEPTPTFFVVPTAVAVVPTQEPLPTVGISSTDIVATVDTGDLIPAVTMTVTAAMLPVLLPTDTPVPGPAALKYPGPILIAPDEGKQYRGITRTVEFSWEKVQGLSPEEYYEITVAYQVAGADQVLLTKDLEQNTAYQLPAKDLRETAPDHKYFWWLTIRQRSPGLPALSERSQRREFYWQP